MDGIMWFCGILIVGLIGLFGMALHFSAKKNGEMIQQCMADGIKEYECRSIIFNGAGRGHVHQPMPVRVK